MFASMLRSASFTSSKSTQSDKAESAPLTQQECAQKEIADLEHALAAAGLLMNDDIEGAEARLQTGEASAYSDLGLMMISFLQAAMGLEDESMRQSSERAKQAEKSSQAALKKAQQMDAAHPGHASTTFYPAGSGFAVINAAAQLMNGVTAVLDESEKIEKLGAAFKAFFKLRKAYSTLHEIIEFETRAAEDRLAKKNATLHVNAPITANNNVAVLAMPGGFGEDEYGDLFASMDAITCDEIQTAVEEPIIKVVPASPQPNSSAAKGSRVQKFHLKLQTRPASSRSSSSNSDHSSDDEDKDSSSSSSPTSIDQPVTPIETASTYNMLPMGQDSKTMGPFSPLSFVSAAETESAIDDLAGELTNPIDIFVHSGANAFFGTLQLVLSAVPPAYKPLLAAAGFRGDRERGVRMLWKASAQPDFCGALAGLVLLVYHTTLSSVADIVPTAHDFDEDAEIIGYPDEKCAALLNQIRARYPDSLLWRGIEGRVLATNQRLKEAITVLSSGPESKMKQVTAVTCFELSLSALFIRDWRLTRDSFLRCVELNDWTHTLYYYCAGIAELEMYRDAVHNNRPLAEVSSHKKAAEALLRRAPQLAGHKRLLHKRIPHEVFVERRVARWEARARDLGVDLADVIGASPAQEMAYIWNGGKKMNPAELRAALGDLEWARCTAPTHVVRILQRMPDENAVHALCAASLLRRLGRYSEARTLLQEKALCYDKTLFKKEYVLPMATYEMATIYWAEATVPGAHLSAELRQRKVDECQLWLDRVMRWGERYLMDGRFGMRFQTGYATLAWYRRKNGWEAPK